MVGLLGKKVGMTHKFSDDGKFIPVSVLDVGSCFVLVIKEKSIQIGFGPAPQTFIKEIKVDNPKDYKVGQELKADIFKEGDFVDLSGISIGKGFAGGMKRWHWRGGPKSHGSTSHRRVGSIGASSDPSRVFRGTHMPGHLGARSVTTQNLKVIQVDSANNLLAIKGAAPGHKNSYLVIRTAKKKKSSAAPVKHEAEKHEKKQDKNV